MKEWLIAIVPALLSSAATYFITVSIANSELEILQRQIDTDDRNRKCEILDDVFIVAAWGVFSKDNAEVTGQFEELYGKAVGIAKDDGILDQFSELLSFTYHKEDLEDKIFQSRTVEDIFAGADLESDFIIKMKEISATEPDSTRDSNIASLYQSKIQAYQKAWHKICF